MKFHKVGYFPLFLLLVIFMTCKTNQSFQPVGSLVSYEGCKTFQNGGGSSQSVNFIHDQNQDCVEFNYFGNNTLEMRHINAGFNCCPGKILAEIDILDDVIIISLGSPYDKGIIRE